MEDYKTSESVDMKNPEAVKYAADQVGLAVSQYKKYVDQAGTYNRKSVEKYISTNHQEQKK